MWLWVIKLGKFFRQTHYGLRHNFSIGNAPRVRDCRGNPFLRGWDRRLGSAKKIGPESPTPTKAFGLRWGNAQKPSLLAGTGFIQHAFWGLLIKVQLTYWKELIWGEEILQHGFETVLLDIGTLALQHSSWSPNPIQHLLVRISLDGNTIVLFTGLILESIGYLN